MDSLERNVKQRVAKWKEMSGKEKPFIRANMAHHGTFDMLLGNQPVKTPLGLGKSALEILETMDVETLKDNENWLTSRFVTICCCRSVAPPPSPKLAR